MGFGQLLTDLVTLVLSGLVCFGLLWTINASLQETQREREKREQRQRKWARRSVRRRP